MSRAAVDAPKPQYRKTAMADCNNGNEQVMLIAIELRGKIVIGGGRRYFGSSEILTSSLPVFEPSKSLLIAVGALFKPSTISTRYFSCPDIYHFASSAMPSI